MCIRDSLNENLRNNNFATSQIFSLTKDKSLKFGLIWSTFKDESSLPILDSYPVLPSPESNISLSSWYGKDRSNGSRKFFIYKTGVLLLLIFQYHPTFTKNIILTKKIVFLKNFMMKSQSFFQLKPKIKI